MTHHGKFELPIKALIHHKPESDDESSREFEILSPGKAPIRIVPEFETALWSLLEHCWGAFQILPSTWPRWEKGRKSLVKLRWCALLAGCVVAFRKPENDVPAFGTFNVHNAFKEVLILITVTLCASKKSIRQVELVRASWIERVSSTEFCIAAQFRKH